jgi:hypothetical protein
MRGVSTKVSQRKKYASPYKNINNKLRNCFIEEFLKSSVRRNKRGINIAVSLLSVANAVSKNANLILSL